MYKVNLSKKQLLFTIAMIASLGAGVVYAQSPDAAKALRLADTEQTAKAVESAKASIQANPTINSLWYYLGYVQIKAGDKKGALESFNKLISLNEKDPLGYAGKGMLAVLDQNPVETKTNLDKAASLTKSSNTEAQKAIAEAYLGDKKYAKEAVAILSKAKSDDAEVQILLGDAYLFLANGGAAVTAYEQAARLNPTSGRAHYKVGMVYERSNNHEVAIESLNKATTTDPGYTKAFKELGEIYYLKKEGDKAVKAYETYLSLTEKPEPAKLRYAFFLFMAKNYKKANEIFAPLSTAPDVVPLTLRYYSYSLVEAQELEKSLTVFEQYFNKAKKEEIVPADYNYIAKVQLALGHDSLAIQAYGNSLAMEAKQTEIRQTHADMLFKAKRYAEAADSYKELSKLRATPAAQDVFNMGRSYYLSEKYMEADTAFTKLTELQPERKEGYSWRARTQSQFDPESEKGIAKPFYEKLIEKTVADPVKNKAELVEAYSYMGYYYYIKKDNNTSISWWQKVLGVDPQNVKALEAVKALKEVQKQQKAAANK